MLAGELRTHQMEQRFLHADGHVVWILLNVSLVHLSDGSAGYFVAQMQDISQRKQADAVLTRQGLHDSLTNLANRTLLRDRLEHALARTGRDPSPLALLFLDLDGFKMVNDSLGHDAGDLVLVVVGQRLEAALRPGDTVARLGGDEFGILLEHTHEIEAMGVVDRLLATLAEPIVVEGRRLVVGASVGIATSRGHERAEVVLRNADLAMYEAKSRAGGRAETFRPAMHEAVLRRLNIEAELRSAIDGNELVLHDQPIVSVETGTICGLEALVRWQHPKLGPVPPAHFIPVAESCGLIGPLTEWVLAEATGQLCRWQQSSSRLADLGVAVNMSVRQLQQRDSAWVVANALDAVGLDPDHLTLEITESVLMDTMQASAMLAELRGIGVRLAIDDFGTGYSSLSRLHAFPVDKVKIDRSFVTDIRPDREAPIVVATIALARSLSLATVAEGVESPEQLEFLRRHGCNEAQGYLFSRPLDSSAVEELLLEPAGPTVGCP